MGVLVMVIGKSGSGKSTSLRNFEDGTIGVLNVASKPLPFRRHLPTVDGADYAMIRAALASGKYRAYAIDDSTYLMQFAMFDHAKEQGYGKFTTMALDFKGLLDAAVRTPPDTVVYFLHHPQFGEDGSSKPQTVGKMLDQQLNIEGLFPVVIECAIRDGQHVFVTENDGYGIAKAPVEVETGERMLPPVMPNDLKAVDDAIRAFWGLKPIGKGEDDAVAK